MAMLNREFITDFGDACEKIHACFISHYEELDAQKHCYFTIKDAFAFAILETPEPYINLRSFRSGEIVHTITQESGFECAIFTTVQSHVSVVFHFRNQFTYHAFIRLTKK
jgi:hypothetical protein